MCVIGLLLLANTLAILLVNSVTDLKIYIIYKLYFMVVGWREGNLTPYVFCRLNVSKY